MGEERTLQEIGILRARGGGFSSTLLVDVRQSSRAKAGPAEVVVRGALSGALNRSKRPLGLHRFSKSNACKRPLNPRYEALDG